MRNTNTYKHITRKKITKTTPKSNDTHRGALTPNTINPTHHLKLYLHHNNNNQSFSDTKLHHIIDKKNGSPEANKIHPSKCQH
jgi:hypothetical protein